MEPTLPQSVGWVVILVMSAFFAVLINIFTFIQNKYTRYNSNKVDEFTSASRSIPFSLCLVAIVSSWTWSLTLLQPSTLSYNAGIFSGWGYAAGGICQVAVFSIIAAKIKKNANLVTTTPEMGYFRFGTAGHLAFLWCAFVCNAIVSACILLGGSAVVHGITGVNEYAALYLIPAGVAVFVSFGGIRSTFISDATHTVVLVIFVLVFVFTVYASGNVIGSPQKMWDLLQQQEPVVDNYHGSYLTFRSKTGGIFLIISIITGFGLVINDQAYLSRAVASHSNTISKSYYFGAICWFIIPFAMATTLGLSARALTGQPGFPELSDSEVSAGLVSVAAAHYLLGKTGSAMILVMVFLSVTSSYSGELIATSTILSYDVYKKYINRNASPERVVLVAKICVVIWVLFSATFAAILKVAKIDMGWLFVFLGTSTASGVFPIALSFTWKDLNTVGAVGGSVGGMILAIIVWLVTCKAYLGEITVANLANQWVSFAGNCTALFMGGIISITASLIKPANFDWENKTRNRSILTDQNFSESSGSSRESSQDVAFYADTETAASKDGIQTKYPNEIKETKEGGQALVHVYTDPETPETTIDKNSIDHKGLDRQFKKYTAYVLVMALIIVIVVPVPLISAPYVFSPKFFTVWVAAIIVWLFFTLTMVFLYPLWEYRQDLKELLKKVLTRSKNQPIDNQ